MRIVTLPRALRRGKRMAIVDAIEEDAVRLEVGEAVRTVPRADVPADAREGDVLVWRIDRWRRDEAATAARRRRIEERVRRLLRRKRRDFEPR